MTVDTGLGHLGGAFGKPLVLLWGPTKPDRLKPAGALSRSLVADFPCAPCESRRCSYQGDIQTFPACFTDIPPQRVIKILSDMLG